MSSDDDRHALPERWVDSTVERSSVLSGIERRDFLKATGVAAALGVLGSSPTSAQEDDQYYRKTRPTAFTEEDRQNALENIERYDWAEAERDSSVEIAETILDYWDYDEMWNLIPSQLVPRGNALYGSGNTYASTAESQGWSWEKMDPEWDHLYGTAPSFNWEITNEDSGITIPTNDFAAYRESGRDDEGKFDPELADDSLLVNTKHPELGEGWGVDDGTGFVDDEGHIGEEGEGWHPVSWLNHWGVIYAARQLIWRLSVAYLYTGEQKYARPAALMLDRVGDVYGDLNHRELYDYYGTTFSNSSGGTSQGKFVGGIWEASQIREWMWSYDRVFPGMDGDEELVEFLDGKRSEYPDLAAKDTLGAVRENIEAGFIHEMLPAFKNAQIRGNFGFHQSTLAVAGVVADDPEGMTGDAIDYLFQPGTLLGPGDDGNPTSDRWYTTGGDILGFLVGSPQSGYMVDEEGYPNESAPHYNTSQQNSVETVAAVLRGYDGYAGSDLFRNPKFKRAVDSHWQLTFGKYLPQIANTHGVGNPKAVAGSTPLNDRVIQSAEFALTGFDEYRTVELAQWTYMLNGMSTDGLEMGIFHPNPIEIKDEIRSIVDEHGPFPNLDSDQQAAYGFSALRDGDPSSPRGVYQYYGRNSFGTGSAHTHRDTLNLGVYGYDLDLSPELGRQGSDWEGNRLGSWVESTPAHNTVTVDEENVRPQWVGYPKHFDHTGRVQLMDVEAPRVYPQTDEYRRTTAMVNADEQSSYVVDFFRVDGGSDHHFSFHAMTSRGIETEELDLEAQNGGTYEGEDVGFRRGGHFSYLYDVERDDDPEPGFSVDWDIEDYWQVRDDDGGPVHLRLTMLEEVDDVAMATGRPAEQDTENNPRELPFVLAHRGREVDEPDPEVEYGDRLEFDEGEGTTRTSAYQGIRVEPHRDLEGFRVQIDPGTSGISHATIRDAEGAILAERDVAGVDPGDYVDIPYGSIEAGTTYLVVFGNYGDVYTRNSGSFDFPGVTDDFTVDAGVYFETSSTTNSRYNVTEIRSITEYDEPEPPEAEPVESTFTSVIEPYEGERVVESTELVEVTSEDDDADLDAVRAVKVEHVDGRTDYVVSSTDMDSKFKVDGRLMFRGAFAVYAERDGEREFAYTNDALLLTPDGEGSDTPLDRRSLPRYRGEVEDFTKDLSLDNELVVEITDNPRGASLSDLVGNYIYVEPNDPDPIPDGVQEDDRYDNEARDERNGVFLIQGVERTGRDRATIDIGEHTLIRRYYTNDPADGYSYSIEEGAEFVIPLGRLAE